MGAWLKLISVTREVGVGAAENSTIVEVEARVVVVEVVVVALNLISRRPRFELAMGRNPATNMFGQHAAGKVYKRVVSD